MLSVVDDEIRLFMVFIVFMGTMMFIAVVLFLFYFCTW